MTPPRARPPKGVSRQLSPDAELGRAFAVGCGLLLLAFLCGWAVIALFWLR